MASTHIFFGSCHTSATSVSIYSIKGVNRRADFLGGVMCDIASQGSEGQLVASDEALRPPERSHRAGSSWTLACGPGQAPGRCCFEEGRVCWSTVHGEVWEVVNGPLGMWLQNRVPALSDRDHHKNWSGRVWIYEAFLVLKKRWQAHNGGTCVKPRSAN